MNRPRVLLVDDLAAVRQTLRHVLGRYGCDFTEAEDGATALDLMSRTAFDVVFLDLKLPELSGIEILQRAHEGGVPLGRVIVLTGFSEPEVEAETARLGVFSHLTKDPISPARVRETFEAAFAEGGQPAPRPVDPPAAPGPETRQPARAAQPPAGPRKRILVLDDQVHALDTIERLLEPEFAVTRTEDPAAACRLAERERFDAVILDVKLSGTVTGLDVLQRIAETTTDLRAIILTGMDEDPDELALLSGQLGARMFIRKQHVATLPERVRRILREPAAAPKVFLSYDRGDWEKVRKLYRRLKRHGMRPWMDTEDLLPGDQWNPSIAKRIGEAHHFVFCNSHRSWDKEGPLRRERNLALDRLRDLREERHFLIVARLDDAKVAESLLPFHHVNPFTRGGFRRLLRAISADAASR